MNAAHAWGSGGGSAGRRALWTDLGRQAYGPVWALQKRLASSLADGEGPDRLLLVEHEPVITLGRRADPAHVLASAETLRELGIERFEVERGGDVTYHGPGQLVAYPILNLRRHRQDLRWLSRSLAGCMVDCLAELGVAAEAGDGERTGVWTRRGKIGALGLRVERWVCYHGAALNIDPEPGHFELIVPCGLDDARVDSLRLSLGWAPTWSAVSAAFRNAFARRFDLDLIADPGFAATVDLSLPVAEIG